MDKKIYLSYPVHSLVSGPMRYSNIDCKADSLNGVYLDYAYLLATHESSSIVLHFYPDGTPSGVQIGDIGNLKNYQSTATREEMIAAVKKIWGDIVTLPKPEKASTP